MQSVITQQQRITKKNLAHQMTDYTALMLIITIIFSALSTLISPVFVSVSYTVIYTVISVSLTVI